MRKIVTSLLILAFAMPMAFAQQDSVSAKKSRQNFTLQAGNRLWKGDFGGMTERRIIRALVPYSKTFFYVEKGSPRGVSHDILSTFEKDLNRKLKTKHLKLKVLYVPVGREDLIPMLNDGRGDLVIADLSITPERQKLVDFSEPMFTGIREIPVTGAGGPAINSVDDLSGQEVFVRKSSSYFEHLKTLNNRFSSEGKAPVKIREVSEDLEAEDILEMVNAGLVGMTIVDGYKAKMWSAVFTKLRLHREASISDDNAYAFLMRKDSPKLMAAVNDFVARHNQDTSFGRSVINRYSKNPKFVKNAAGAEERERFGNVVELFRKYGDQYDVDHLLMMAQGFQESQLDNNARSPVGAIGIMQIMPATGGDLNVGDITVLANNVNGGVKYMRFMIDQFYDKEPMTPLNKGLFAFAAYNAGPGRVAQLRKEAAKRGLDPNRWFHNVEVIAAEKIGSETVTYVANIFKYYTAYKLIEEQEAERRKARDSFK
ncbi:MAG: transporter substrate-binding domain-containing protein [Betaproteobacteria bacterium]